MRKSKAISELIFELRFFGVQVTVICPTNQVIFTHASEPPLRPRYLPEKAKIIIRELKKRSDEIIKRFHDNRKSKWRNK